MWTIQELFNVIDNYMSEAIDGDDFELEQDFEDAIRAKLEEECFTVFPKRNVENTKELVEQRIFGVVDHQIPDIAVNCRDGLVFLELKFCSAMENYAMDVKKVETYYARKKCAAVAVLFLDEKNKRKDWSVCEKNKRYAYYFATLA